MPERPFGEASGSAGRARGSFSDEELDRALQALTEPERFNQAEARVARIAPQLQHVLGAALDVGGYFGQLRDGELLSAAKREELDERVRALRTLLAEETRLGMLVGVAVGWELARELELERTEEET